MSVEPPSHLPPRFIGWGRTSTPPPEFWSESPTPEDEDGDEETSPPDLWQRVGDVRPWGTAALLFVWCVSFAVLALAGATGRGRELYRFGASGTFGDPWREPWRWLATTALHSGTLHLIMNGITLAIFGPAMERVFARGGFWIVIALGGALSSVASLAYRAARDGGAPSVSVGGSGALFALGGALIAAAWRLRRQLPPSRARALGGALVLLLCQSLVAGFNREGTDNVAHLAGLAAGIVLGAALPLDPRLEPAPPGGELLRWLGAAAAAALAAAVAWGLYLGIRASGGFG